MKGVVTGEKGTTQGARKLSLSHHSVGDVRKVENCAGSVKQSGSESGDGRGEDGRGENTHVKIDSGSKGSGEHEPSCIAYWDVCAGLSHLFKEFGIRLGQLEAFVGISEKVRDGTSDVGRVMRQLWSD